MGRSFKRRVFSVRIPREAWGDIESFLERVAEALKSYGATIKLRGDSLLVEVYGQEYMIRESWVRLKRLLSEYTPGGEEGYSLARISKDVGLAVPGDVLAVVLRLEGSRAEYRDGRLVTDAPYDVVVDAARRVRKALEEAKALAATRTAKKAVVAAAALTGLEVDRVVAAGLEAGLLSEDEEGKIAIKGPWEQLVRRLARVAEEWSTGPGL